MQDQDKPSVTIHVWLIALFFMLVALFGYWVFTEYHAANWCNVHSQEMGSKIKCARFYSN